MPTKAEHPRGDPGLAGALHAIAREIHDSSEQRKAEMAWLRSRFNGATKQDIETLGKLIMASQQELAADLQASVVQLKKTLGEIKSVQDNTDVLKAKIVELEALVAAGGAIGPELVQAVADVKNLTQAVDDSIPDTAPTEPPPEPTAGRR